jgi:peptidyl-prolyl cis-trans isomerase A (cyclophilin A)
VKPPPPKPAPVKPPPKPEAPEAWKVPDDANPALSDPTAATKTAPDAYKVRFETTKGDFVVQITRDWAPNGADRLYNLVDVGFYDQVGFFRVIDGFMVQFGMSPYPPVSKIWADSPIKDDPVKETNKAGRLTFATAGPNTRTSQLFINYGNNVALDRQGFAPLGEVVTGMEVVNSIYKGYGEGAPRGRGPSQGKLKGMGNAYLKDQFPKLDYINKATILP